MSTSIPQNNGKRQVQTLILSADYLENFSQSISEGDISNISEPETLIESFQYSKAISRGKAQLEVTEGRANNLKEGFHRLLNTNKLNVPKNWLNGVIKDGDTIAEKLFKHIKAGNTVRGANKVRGSNDAVDYVHTIFLDFDISTTEHTLSVEWSKYAAFWYHTPGYVQGQNQKHRLVFPLSRHCSEDEAGKIIVFLMDAYGESDEACKDVARLFFPAKTESDIYEINFSNRLPIDEILPQCKKKVITSIKEKDSFDLGKTKSDNHTKESNQKDSEESITYQILRYLRKFWIEVCDGEAENLGEFFVTSLGIKNHDYEWTEVNPGATDKGVERKWVGYNLPCHRSPEKRDDGLGFPDSLVLEDFGDEYFPLFYLRNGGDTGSKTTLNVLEYWFDACQFYRGKWRGKTLKTEGVFKEVVKDFCEKCGLEPFKFPKKSKKNDDTEDFDLEVIFDFLIENYSEKIFICKWERVRGVRKYFAFDSDNGTWDYIATTSMLTPIFIDELEVQFGKISLKAQALLEKHFEKYWRSAISTPIPENTRFIPFQNGLYDVETKQLLPNNGEAFNKFIYPFDYSEVGSDNSVIQNLVTYFQRWSKSEIVGKLLLDWLILSAQRKAKQTSNAIGFIGEAGAGKTSYGLLIASVVGKEFTRAILAKQLIGNNVASHAMAQIEYKHYIHLRECKGDTADMDMEILKDLSGNKDMNTFSINPKGEAVRDIVFNGVVSFDTEKNIKFPAGETDGYERRFVMIDVTYDWKQSELIPDLEQLQNNPVTILLWALSQDGNAALAEFNELKNHPELKAHKERVKRESNPLFQFVDECLVVTNDEDDKLTSVEVQEIYKIWSEDFDSRGRLNQQNLRKILGDILLKSYNWERKLYNKDRYFGDVGGIKKQVRGYVGIKASPEYQDFGSKQF